MDFSEALSMIKKGLKVSREGWNGKDQYVGMDLPGDKFITCCYCYLKNSQGLIVPWVPSQGDLFAVDWVSL